MLDEFASETKSIGLKKAVLRIVIPNVTPEIVGSDLNEIIAIKLHSIAKKIPPTGIKIEIAPNINEVIAIAFIM